MEPNDPRPTNQLPPQTAETEQRAVTDPELQTYVPEATVVPRVLHAEEWPFVGVGSNTCPLVVHAPSRRGVKGTEAILRAVERLQKRVNFRFMLIENLPHAEAKAAYKEADVVIDQLRIGWYGVLATETMALGKPTIAYIRDDLWHKHGAKLPIIDGHLELPDLRLEYESVDGRVEYRDVELVTEHYSRGQLGGKRAAGFAMYRARGGHARTGGTPFDPHHLERL